MKEKGLSLRSGGLALLAVVYVFYCVGLAAYFAAHHMFWADEFNSLYLTSDPSWRHMVESWEKGVDSGGILYYFVGRLVLLIGGQQPNALRIYSSLCEATAGILLFRILRRHWGTVAALAATALLTLCTVQFLDHLSEARFYGQFVLGVALCVTFALWAEDTKAPPITCFLISLLAGTALACTHMLGVGYTVALVLAQMLAPRPIHLRRVFSIAGTVLSWGTLLLFVSVLKAGAEVMHWIQRPTLTGMIRFYLHSPVFLPSAPKLSIVLNVLLYLAIAVAAVQLGRQGWAAELADGRRRVTLVVAGLFLLAPWGLYVLSITVKPLFAERYVMPFLMGFVTLLAWALAKWSRRWAGVAMWALPIFALVHIFAVRDTVRGYEPYAAMDPFLRLSSAVPVVLEDEVLVKQMHLYHPLEAKNTYFLIGHKPHDITWAMLDQGYIPATVDELEFEASHPHFLFINASRGVYEHTDRILTDPGFTVRPVGTVLLHGQPTPVYDVVRR